VFSGMTLIEQLKSCALTSSTLSCWHIGGVHASKSFLLEPMHPTLLNITDKRMNALVFNSSSFQ
jgi:hypothetical protein